MSEKKMLEREDDKERIRSLEKSLCLEKKKSRALEIKVQELEPKEFKNTQLLVDAAHWASHKKM